MFPKILIYNHLTKNKAYTFNSFAMNNFGGTSEFIKESCTVILIALWVLLCIKMSRKYFHNLFVIKWYIVVVFIWCRWWMPARVYLIQWNFLNIYTDCDAVIIFVLTIQSHQSNSKLILMLRLCNVICRSVNTKH